MAPRRPPTTARAIGGMSPRPAPPSTTRATTDRTTWRPTERPPTTPPRPTATRRTRGRITATGCAEGSSEGCSAGEPRPNSPRVRREARSGGIDPSGRASLVFDPSRTVGGPPLVAARRAPVSTGTMNGQGSLFSIGVLSGPVLGWDNHLYGTVRHQLDEIGLSGSYPHRRGRYGRGRSVGSHEGLVARRAERTA